MTEQQGQSDTPSDEDEAPMVHSSSLGAARDKQDDRQDDTTTETSSEQVFHPDRDTGFVEDPGGEVKVTYITKSPRKMKARSAVGIGVTIMGILGIVFWTSYSLVSFAFCSGLPRQCPSSWVPYAAIATSGFVAMLLIGAAVAWVFYKLYGILRVD